MPNFGKLSSLGRDRRSNPGDPGAFVIGPSCPQRVRTHSPPSIVNILTSSLVMKYSLAILLAVLLAEQASAQDVISVNLYSRGKPPEPTVWNDPGNLLTLTLEEDESAGVVETTGWINVDLGNPFSNNEFGPVELTGSGGATATLQILDRRNSGPWNWNGVRDDSDSVSVGNATLLDGHTNGTEVDGNGNNPFPEAITDIEITDISFPSYDVIVYIGANSGQYFDGGANIRVNEEISVDPLDSSGGLDFTLTAGEPDGTLTEITEDGGTGNYVVYRGLTDPTFRYQVWGNGFNHIGSSGFQVVSSQPSIPFEITGVSYASESNEVTLDWTSNPGEIFTVRFSEDLQDWTNALDDAYPAAEEGNSTTATFDLTGLPVDGSKLFFRVEKE